MIHCHKSSPKKVKISRAFYRKSRALCHRGTLLALNGDFQVISFMIYQRRFATPDIRTKNTTLFWDYMNDWGGGEGEGLLWNLWDYIFDSGWDLVTWVYCRFLMTVATSNPLSQIQSHKLQRLSNFLPFYLGSGAVHHIKWRILISKWSTLCGLS